MGGAAKAAAPVTAKPGHSIPRVFDTPRQGGPHEKPADRCGHAKRLYHRRAGHRGGPGHPARRGQAGRKLGRPGGLYPRHPRPRLSGHPGGQTPAGAPLPERLRRLADRRRAAPLGGQRPGVRQAGFRLAGAGPLVQRPAARQHNAVRRLHRHLRHQQRAAAQSRTAGNAGGGHCPYTVNFKGETDE